MVKTFIFDVADELPEHHLNTCAFIQKSDFVEMQQTLLNEIKKLEEEVHKYKDLYLSEGTRPDDMCMLQH